MDSEQMELRIGNLLRTRLWAGSGSRVFAPDSVVEGLALPSDVAQVIMPAAVVRAGTFTADEETPEKLDEDMIVTITQQIFGDRFGFGALHGANRTNATTSEGRGLREIQREVLAALVRLAPPDVNLILAAGSGDITTSEDDNLALVSRQLVFKARTTTFTTRERPRIPSGGLLSQAAGTVTIDWDAPDDATDLIEYEVRRVAGWVPVAGGGDGTAVATIAAGTTVTTNVPGAGDFTYQVFCKYADPSGATALHFSDFIYETITVV